MAVAIKGGFAKLMGPALQKIEEDIHQRNERNMRLLELERVEYNYVSYSQDGDDPIVLDEGNAVLIRQTERAVLVAFGPVTDYWIPKSALHPTSGVNGERPKGTLVIKKWFARKVGLL